MFFSLLDKSNECISIPSEYNDGIVSLTHNNDYYEVTCVNNNSTGYIPVELADNCSIELDVERVTGNCGIGLLKSNGDIWGFVKAGTDYVNQWSYKNKSWSGGKSHYFTTGLDYTGYLHFKIIKTGSNIQLIITNSDNEILLDKSFTLISWLVGKTLYAGIFQGVGNSKVKNFKIKVL